MLLTVLLWHRLSQQHRVHQQQRRRDALACMSDSQDFCSQPSSRGWRRGGALYPSIAAAEPPGAIMAAALVSSPAAESVLEPMLPAALRCSVPALFSSAQSHSAATAMLLSVLAEKLRTCVTLPPAASSFDNCR